MKLPGDAEKKLQQRINDIKRQSKQRRLEERPNISLQGYRPDTCGCYLIQLRDENVPDLGQSGLQYDHMAHKCPGHAMLEDEECYDAVLALDGEQRRKNGFIAQAAELSDDVGRWNDQDGNRSRVPREDVRVLFSFTGEGRDRKMHIAIVGREIRAQGVDELQTILDELPGDNVLVSEAADVAWNA